MQVSGGAEDGYLLMAVHACVMNFGTSISAGIESLLSEPGNALGQLAYDQVM